MSVEKSFSNWLIVSDIDGTLNNKFRRLPERNKKAIEDFVAKGGRFTLASGRNAESMEKHFKNLPISGTPAVVINGAGIYDFEKQEMIHFSPMNDSAMDLCVEVAKKFPLVDVLVIAKDTIYVTGIGWFGKIFVGGNKLSHKCVRHISDVPRGEWGKVIFSGLPFLIKKIKNRFETSGSEDITTMLSSIASFEILAADTHKGTAVLKLAEILGISNDHTGAIGDYFNDYEMLKSVGVPACCGQAPKELKEVSEFVACHCNHGAVADFIEYIKNK
ncbi:MAG: Cof-type HAD-IIB family hydrolase [Clostridia bacterium]|nr:Cof-type HAD-IIB family hydrolase [Clostridia bacterium]